MATDTPSTRWGADVLSLFAGAAVQQITSNTSADVHQPLVPSRRDFALHQQIHNHSNMPQHQDSDSTSDIEQYDDEQDEDGDGSQSTPISLDNGDSRSHRLFSVDGFPTPRPVYGNNTRIVLHASDSSSSSDEEESSGGPTGS